MATHSSILAWRIPWTEEPGGLQSTESQRVGPDGSDLVCTYTHTHTHTQTHTYHGQIREKLQISPKTWHTCNQVQIPRPW